MWKIERVRAVAGRAMAIVLAIVVLGTSQVAAQTDDGLPPLMTDPIDEIPPELDILDSLPTPPDAEDGTAIDGWAGDDESSMLLLSQPLDGPVPLRSSGTWIRRGFWFVEEDVVIMTRDINNRFILLGFDAAAGVRNRLLLDGGDAGVGANARLTLGRFLYRDQNGGHTRDHFAEFTFQGLGQWSSEGGIEAIGDTLGGTFNPLIVDDGFNGTHTQDFFWKSRFNSYGFNYRVRRRMGRDRVVLEPTGEWTRQIDSGNIYSYLFGVRYFDLSEDFRFIALNTNPNFRRGDLSIRTSNDLIGFQFGGDAIHQRARWSVGVRGKTGAYVNFASMNSNLLQVINFIPTTTLNRADKDVLSFVGELGIFAAYHVRPNISFRVAFESLWASSLATAGKQRALGPGRNTIVGLASDVTFMGLSTGVDIYW